jgi:IstB-like ATP binding protein
VQPPREEGAGRELEQCQRQSASRPRSQRAERVWRALRLQDLYSSGKEFELTGRAMGFAALAMLTVIPLLVFVAAADNRQLSRVVGRYGRLDLLLLDDLGYVQLDPRGAELLFQIITEREERASIAIGTNLPFS